MSEELTATLNGMMPLGTLLGITAHRMDPGETVLSMPWRADLCTTGGLLHGGAIMALADSAGGASGRGTPNSSSPVSHRKGGERLRTTYLGAVR